MSKSNDLIHEPARYISQTGRSYYCFCLEQARDALYQAQQLIVAGSVLQTADIARIHSEVVQALGDA